MSENITQPVVERKRGRLSVAEEDFIKTNAGRLHPQQIAEQLGRTVEPIFRYLREHPVPMAAANDVERDRTLIRAELRGSAAWKRLAAEFETEELRYFEEKYVDLVRQFREDVLPTEENQIMKAIKYDILMSRNLEQRKKLRREIFQLEHAYEDILQQFPLGSKTDEHERFRALTVRTALEGARSAEQQGTQEYTRLEEKHQKLMEALKATREQRINKIESGRKSFMDLIRMLADQESRDAEGRQIEQMRRATEKELKRLGRPHTFVDGVDDLPILSADTLEALDVTTE